MVWPMRMRHRPRKHAFEEALDNARLTADDELEDFVGAASANPMAAPGIGSLGDITVAAGYVARASLARAYAGDGDSAEVQRSESPGEAAQKLVALLALGGLSPAEMRRMRRRFAAENHPDRVAPEARAEALRAMAEVNAAIDRALARPKKN